MKINRHNYETFFLMYADNELSASEKATVEQFVKQNHDLEEELSLIMDTILPAEALSFEGKESLFKTAIDESLQERLLLRIDNELSAEEIAAVEKIINADKVVAAEWNILQATKLDAAEKIVFENKSVLYRREKDNVVVMRFVKYAVAAGLVGMGFYLGISLMENKKSIIPTEVAVKKPGEPRGNKAQNSSLAKVGDNPAPGTKPGSGIEVKDNPVKAPLVAKTNDKGIINNPADKNVKEKQAVPSLEKDLAVNPLPKQQNNIPEHLINIKEEQIASLIPKEKSLTIVDVQDKSITPLQGTDNARVAMLDNNEANADNRILFMEEEKITRSKAAGFLRKLKRTVERNIKIKTGDEIRIAGFSFAVK